MHKIRLVILLSGLALTQIFASDHIDGPITTKHKVGDLTDLYAFPTPNTPGSITLILNAYPFAPPTTHFPERVDYNFFVRRANVNTSGPQPVFETSDEIQIVCQFKTPQESAQHTITCKSTSGLQATSRVNETVSTGDCKVFFGLRSDPFFFNAKWAVSASTKGTLLPPQNSNSMASLNVLSIVIDVDVNKLFPGAPYSLFAIAASTTTQDDANAPVRQLDRIGRPEITNASMIVSNGTELRDLYNQERPFKVSPDHAELYRARLKEKIAFYDRIDGKVEWPEADQDALAAILLDDFLIIDMAKPSGSDNFFEIEKAALQRKEHATCGGRKPADDVMDILLTFYINRDLEAKVRDGVDKPDKPISDQFPYLAPPSTGIWARTKAAFARWYFGQ